MTLAEAMSKLRRARYVVMRREIQDGQEYLAACVFELEVPRDQDTPADTANDRVLAGISAPLDSTTFERQLIDLIEKYA